MKKLFYRLACSRSMAKIFSTDAQLEKKNRVIFFAVLALLAFVSLGAFVFPHVGHAQECVWDCDLGSDINDFPWGNSPQSQLDIAYCIDRDCVFTRFSPLIGSLPSNTTDVGQKLLDSSCSAPNTKDVEISGKIVAMLRDGTGSLIAGSAAQGTLLITIKCVTVTGLGSGSSILSRVVVPKELRTNVFKADSNITILKPVGTTPASLSHPVGWTGCPNTKGILSGNCAFPLGIVEFKNNNAIQQELPKAPPFVLGEVFRAEELTRFIGIRDCKGPADSTPGSIDPTAIQCSVGGGQSLALLSFGGNWSGAGAHTFNPKSGSNPYDIDLSTLPPGISVKTNTVLASANGGNPIAPTGCNAQDSQDRERCFFSAKDLLPGGCKSSEPVIILVTGQLDDGSKFQSTDNPACSNK